MVQHINLLSKRKARKGLMSSIALSLLGLWVLVLAMVAASGEWQLQRQRDAQSQMRQSVANLTAALEKKRQDNGLVQSETMTKQISLLRGQIEAKREWADLLQKGELGNPSGYSQWFESLASVHVEGVWLQGLDIGKAGQTVVITGKSLNADAVLRYIEQVNEAFKPLNVHFSSMEITQDGGGAEVNSPRQPATLSFKIF